MDLQTRRLKRAAHRLMNQINRNDAAAVATPKAMHDYMHEAERLLHNITAGLKCGFECTKLDTHGRPGPS